MRLELFFKDNLNYRLRGDCRCNRGGEQDMSVVARLRPASQHGCTASKVVRLEIAAPEIAVPAECRRVLPQHRKLPAQGVDCDTVFSRARLQECGQETFRDTDKHIADGSRGGKVVNTRQKFLSCMTQYW